MIDASVWLNKAVKIEHLDRSNSVRVTNDEGHAMAIFAHWSTLREHESIELIDELIDALILMKEQAQRGARSFIPEHSAEG